MFDGVVYATSGWWRDGANVEQVPNTAALVRITDKGVHEVANTWDLEERTNPDGYLVESNPFGLTVGPDGRLWIADAAANTLLAIDVETGSIEVEAIFGGIESPVPNSNRDGLKESDPVPTGVAFDDDGAAYVSFLPGSPMEPGKAKIVRIASDGSVTDFATDLTMLVDLERGPDGELYAVSFGNPGGVVRVAEGSGSKTILSGLPFPTSIGFTGEGDALVTLAMGTAPGSGKVVRYELLSSDQE